MKKGELINPSEFDGGTWIPDWLMARPELDLSAKAVYARMRRYANNRNYCWPFKTTIAGALLVSESTVVRAIRELTAFELLKVESVEDRRQNPDLYESVETSGNRYFFVAHEWMPGVSSVPNVVEVGVGTEKPTCQNDRSDLSKRQVAPVKKTGGPPSPPYVKRVSEESQTHNASEPLTASATFALSGDQNQAREGLLLEPGAGDQTQRESPRTELRGVEHLKGTTARREGDSDACIMQESEDVSKPTTKMTVDFDAVVRTARAKVLIDKSLIKSGAAEEKKAQRKGRKALTTEQKKAWAAQRKQTEIEQGLEPVEAVGKPTTWLQQLWLSEFKVCFPDLGQPRKWGLAEYGQAKHLLDLYEVDRVGDAIQYVLYNWKAINEKFFKGEGGASPGLGLLVKCHQSLFANASVWIKYKSILDKYDAFDPDPNVDRPSDLLEGRREARKALKALGL